MTEKSFVSITITIMLSLTFLSICGCKGKISESSDPKYKAQFEGMKIIVNEDFFVIRFNDNVIKEYMIEVCGKAKVPTKEQFLRQEVTSYIGDEILRIKNGGEKFIITNRKLYTRGPSEGFTFFVIKSLEDSKSYFITKHAQNYGIKHGYIKEIQK